MSQDTVTTGDRLFIAKVYMFSTWMSVTIQRRVKVTRAKDGLHLLVNASGAYVKVSLGECARFIIDQVDARAGATAVTPGASCIITTKSQVDDDAVVSELCVKIAALAVREERSWGTLQKRSRRKQGKNQFLAWHSSDQLTQESVLI